MKTLVSISTPVPLRERDGRGLTVAGASPNPPAPSTVSTTPGRVTVEPPSGGDSRAHTRSAAPRVAPAPIRFAVRVVILAAVYFGIHGAATNPLAALVVSGSLIAINLILARRSHHA